MDIQNEKEFLEEIEKYKDEFRKLMITKIGLTNFINKNYSLIKEYLDFDEELNIIKKHIEQYRDESYRSKEALSTLLKDLISLGLIKENIIIYPIPFSHGIYDIIYITENGFELSEQNKKLVQDTHALIDVFNIKHINHLTGSEFVLFSYDEYREEYSSHPYSSLDKYIL